MSLEYFIINVFCWVDAYYHRIVPCRLRQRGPQAQLADSEVITMELVGEFLGFHEETAIWNDFKTH